jgi:hypothetical protein
MESANCASLFAPEIAFNIDRAAQPVPALEWAVHSAEKPADAHRYHSSRIRLCLDIVSEPLFQRRRRIADSASGVRRGITGLPVQVLRGSNRLIRDPLDLALAVAGNPTEAFFDFPAHGSNCSCDPIFVHG